MSRLPPVFSLGVYGFRFTFNSLIHFELIFVYGVSQGSSFILWHMNIQFSQYRLLNRLPFPCCVFFAPLLYIYALFFFSLGLHSVTLIAIDLLCLLLGQYHVILITIAFVIQLEIRKYAASSFDLLSQDFFGYLECFVVP